MIQPLRDKLTLVIHTCDKFSDLWDAHIKLLSQNWHDRDIETLLVTDCQTDRKFDGVTVLSTGDGMELSQRTAAVLPQIKTEYVLVTLDDYFPIYPICSEKIAKLVAAMDKEGLDYIRLFKRPNSRKRLKGYRTLYEIDLNSKKDTHYQVNLYAGIWRKSFLEKTVDVSKNAWEYELSLTKIARREHLKCAMSKGKEFEILDVVRKGQLLHKSNRYLKKHDLYHGPRAVISWKAEWKINFMTLIKDLMPQRVVDIAKSVMRKRGHTFYSDDI